MWHAHNGMGWWMLFGALLWILFWASIIWLVISFFRPQARQSTEQPPDSALEIARRRYARGEITREEYLRLREDLGGPGEPSPG